MSRKMKDVATQPRSPPDELKFGSTPRGRIQRWIRTVAVGLDTRLNTRIEAWLQRDTTARHSADVR